MKIRCSEPMLPTRPCAFCLSLQEDCVFADFDLDEAQRAYIVRISYDSFGCCRTSFGSESGLMSQRDTSILLSAVAKGQVQTPEVEEVLRAYLSEHQKDLWPDALAEHGLIDDPPS